MNMTKPKEGITVQCVCCGRRFRWERQWYTKYRGLDSHVTYRHEWRVCRGGRLLVVIGTSIVAPSGEICWECMEAAARDAMLDKQCPREFLGYLPDDAPSKAAKRGFWAKIKGWIFKGE